MIHVLAHETRSRSRLSLLLRELGQTADLHNDLESLLRSSRDDEKKSDPVLFDLHSTTADGEACYPRLKKEFEGRALVGFEELDPDAADQGSKRPQDLAHYLLLPPQAERAKARLKTVLAECRRSPNRSISQPAHFSQKGFRRAFNPVSAPRSFPRKPAAIVPAAEHKPFRYLMAQSPASQDFGRKLLAALSFERLLVLAGKSGSEFVLVAREIQYQHHGDRESLSVLSADSVDSGLLHEMEKRAKDAGTQRLCYLEKCEDAPPEAARALQLFVRNMENMRNPHLRLIIGREEDCDFLHGETEEILAGLCKKRTWLHLPPLSDRPEDIRPIAMGFLSALTYAHPFVNVKEIDSEALCYLEENRSRYSYQSLVQALRHSIALGQSRVLTADTIQNLSTRDITSEHFVESIADESYFPQEEACFSS